MKRKTKEQFILDITKVHGDKYDYSLVEYKNSRTKINIICKEHGIFKQNAYSHLDGRGCPICATLYKNNKKSLDTDTFILKAKKIHDNRYDYSLVNYKNNCTKVNIICKNHGIFKQKALSHLNGHGCASCSSVSKLNSKIFIKRSRGIHGDKYDYSLVNYKNMETKVDIICKKHGLFKIKPVKNIHSKQGCPFCNESKGEIIIRNILEKNNIINEPQKKFNDCININPLPFDFYLPKHNICIEFDGEQHYKPIDFFGGLDGLKKIQKRDKIKNEYCENNNIRLLRIKYNENIEDKLNFLL